MRCQHFRHNSPKDADGGSKLKSMVTVLITMPLLLLYYDLLRLVFHPSACDKQNAAAEQEQTAKQIDPGCAGASGIWEFDAG